MTPNRTIDTDRRRPSLELRRRPTRRQRSELALVAGFLAQLRTPPGSRTTPAFRPLAAQI